MLSSGPSSSQTATIAVLALFDEDGQIQWSEGLHVVDEDWLDGIIKLFLASASLAQAFARDAPISCSKAGIGKVDECSSSHDALRRKSTVLLCDEGKHTLIATPCNENSPTQEHHQQQWYGIVVPTVINSNIDLMQGVLPALHIAAAQLTFDSFDNARKLQLLWRATCEHARRLYKHSNHPKLATSSAAYIARCALALSIRFSRVVPIAYDNGLISIDVDQSLLHRQVTEFRTAVSLAWKASNVLLCVITPDFRVVFQHPPRTTRKSMHPAHALAWWYSSFVSVIPSSRGYGIFSLAELAAPSTVRIAFRYNDWALSAVIRSPLRHPKSDSERLEQSAKALITLFSKQISR